MDTSAESSAPRHIMRSVAKRDRSGCSTGPDAASLLQEGREGTECKYASPMEEGREALRRGPRMERTKLPALDGEGVPKREAEGKAGIDAWGLEAGGGTHPRSLLSHAAAVGDGSGSASSSCRRSDFTEATAVVEPLSTS